MHEHVLHEWPAATWCELMSDGAMWDCLFFYTLSNSYFCSLSLLSPPLIIHLSLFLMLTLLFSFHSVSLGMMPLPAGATLPVAMTMPLSPLSSDEEQQRMLGNSQHLYPGAEEEEEEEEEEEMDDDGMDEEGEEENGELELDDEEDVDDEDDIRRGPGHLKGGREEGHRQKGTMAGRIPGDRPQRPGNPGHTANPYSSNPGPTHQAPANQQQPQQQRKLRERSSSNTPDDTHIAMMVFRIGIPDIKQTVSHTHARTHARTHAPHTHTHTNPHLFSNYPLILYATSVFC